jgi:drug/metabolite transporter (DMT)-like permease
MAHVYIWTTVLLTVYGQLVFKWQITMVGTFPSGLGERLLFLLRFILNPWVISSYVAALLASLSWMGALTKLELSYAYPFISVTFVLVLLLSAVFFREEITVYKVLGSAVILLGVFIGSR